MPALTLHLNGDGLWPELAEKLGTDALIHLSNDATIHVGVLPAGMASGLPSVALRIDLPDGRILVAETSARLFVNADRAIAIRYPEVDRG